MKPQPPDVRETRRIPAQPVPGWSGFGSATATVASVLDGGASVLTRSGRSALVLALQRAGVGAGDRVLVPSYYCPAMPAPVEHVGAMPQFYPIGGDGLPDLGWLRAHGSVDCKALLAVHFFGLPKSFAAVREFCDEKGVVLIEDCAHAFFGEVDGVPVGSWGHYAIASLPKFFPVLEGGALVSRERGLDDVGLAAVSAAAEVKAVWNLLELGARYDRIAGCNTIVALASRALSIVRGGVGDAANDAGAVSDETATRVRDAALRDPLLVPMRLRCAERWLVERADRQRIVAARRRNYSRLGDLLSAGADFSPLFPALLDGAAPYVFPVWFREPEPAYAELRRRGLPVLRWNRYWPGADDPAIGGVGRMWGHHVVQVLCHQDLTANDMEAIAGALVQSAGQR